MNKKSIASLSLKGGRKDNFFFCLMEFYEDKDRWFLKSLHRVQDEKDVDRDKAIRKWIDKFNIKHLVVDFPLSPPPFNTSVFNPGAKFDSAGADFVEAQIEKVLNQDQDSNSKNPKKYEQERNKDDEVFYSKNIMAKKSSEPLLSRSFKRRLKRGFLPYWNRELDFWVWLEYYDQYLELFRTSYDSFGDTSLMTLMKFAYIKKSLPADLQYYEGNTKLNLIELLRAKIIRKKDILGLSFFEEAVDSRLDLIRQIERELKIFVYDHDLEILVKNPRAFESFILSLTGHAVLNDEMKKMPDWSKGSEAKFIVPAY